MYAEQRQRDTLRLARATGRVEVTTLAELQRVSVETVRRDLLALEGVGVLKRVHGGAVPVERVRHESELSVRDGQRREVKERIAAAALAEVEGATSVLLDAGSTTARLAELLPADVDLTVVTNSLPIAMLLGQRPRTTVISLGGRVRARTLSTVDGAALRALEGLLVDVAFLGTNGVSVEHGLTTPDLAEAAVKTAMVAASRRSVLLADSSKVGLDELVRFAGLSEVETVYTDSELDDTAAAQLEAAGPTVVRA